MYSHDDVGRPDGGRGHPPIEQELAARQLGVDAHGDAYLPDAYSGHHLGIRESPPTGSSFKRSSAAEWESAATPTGARPRTGAAPLADAAPGQWHWAEQLRHDMIATISDIAMLARRALESRRPGLAQWGDREGIGRGLEDEQFAATQIQLAHLQGDDALADRLVMQLDPQDAHPRHRPSEKP